jgi:hypothetical protein
MDGIIKEERTREKKDAALPSGATWQSAKFNAEDIYT